MKRLCPADHDLTNGCQERFNLLSNESTDTINLDELCPKDLANQINRKGGKRIFTGNLKLERYYTELKVINFIKKIEDAGETVYDN